MTKPQAAIASLDPATMRHQIPDNSEGLMRISQVNRPALVLKDLPVPCACGRPLVAQEYFIVGDGQLGGSAGSVFVRGVCVCCGVQTAIFTPPAQGVETDGAAYERRVTDEIARLVGDVLRLRQINSTGNDSSAPAAALAEVA